MISSIQPYDENDKRILPRVFFRTKKINKVELTIHDILQLRDMINSHAVVRTCQLYRKLSQGFELLLSTANSQFHQFHLTLDTLKLQVFTCINISWRLEFFATCSRDIDVSPVRICIFCNYILQPKSVW